MIELIFPSINTNVELFFKSTLHNDKALYYAAIRPAHKCLLQNSAFSESAFSEHFHRYPTSESTASIIKAIKAAPEHLDFITQLPANMDLLRCKQTSPRYLLILYYKSHFAPRNNYFHFL